MHHISQILLEFNVQVLLKCVKENLALTHRAIALPVKKLFLSLLDNPQSDHEKFIR